VGISGRCGVQSVCMLHCVTETVNRWIGMWCGECAKRKNIIRICAGYPQMLNSCAVLFIKTCWYSLLDGSKVVNALFFIENCMSLPLYVK
jgi:hypothetical protein